MDEQEGLYNFNNELLDQIFEIFIRDFSEFAVELMDQPRATGKQRGFAGGLCAEECYEMNP